MLAEIIRDARTNKNRNVLFDALRKKQQHLTEDLQLKIKNAAPEYSERENLLDAVNAWHKDSMDALNKIQRFLD